MRRSDVQRREGYLDSFALPELSDAVRKSHWSATPHKERGGRIVSPRLTHTRGTRCRRLGGAIKVTLRGVSRMSAAAIGLLLRREV